jgi:predicted ArsR family transcriptional regulator
MTKEEHLKKVQAVRTMDFKDRVDDLNALRQVFGEQVVDVVLAERAKKVEKNWQTIALNHGKNDIEGLKETLWAWVQDAGFEFTVTETNEGTQFHVTKCPFAEMAHELQAADWGYICFCADDPHIVAGFNPAMGFRRTKTLMEGHDCCDHFYYMTPESDVPR